MNKKSGKIKVLQFPIANSFGGITHYALDNWKWMNKDKFQCDFATMSKKLDFADEVLATGSKIHYISCYAEENEKKFIDEVNKILDEGYDVVHLHTKQWKSFLMEQVCLERNVPKIIVHSHSTRCDALDIAKREWETKEHNRVKQEFNTALATDFWACSNEAAEWLFGKQIPHERICIMKNAIEVEKFAYDEKIRKAVRKKLGLDDMFVVGHVGRLAYPKNQEFLIEVFAEVYKENSNMVLLLVGEGELEEELKRKAKELGLEKNINFMGKRADTNILYQAMDLFVMPSRFEGFPITLLEAQTSGLKCLASTNVSEEIKVTDNIEFLDLEIEKWTKRILQYSKGYERIDQCAVIREAGYSIKEQIKEIERLYRA